MDWIFHQRKLARHLSPSEQPSYLPRSPPPLLPPPQSLQSDDSSGLNEVSPTVLLIIIIILAIIFFVSGLIHLSVRFLLKRSSREAEDSDNATAFQGQLQQLFHLHDAGVDQSLIDTLPVFHYKSIIGVNNPFDCAVCLCEFELEDKLRLLPNCSHAFHMECIDTWLLSHSTCPLCRATLLHDFSPTNTCSPAPLVYVLESGIQSSTEIANDRESVVGRSSSVLRSNSNLGPCGDTESYEILEKDEANQAGMVDSDKKVMPVKLGKLRNVDGVEGCSSSHSNNNVDPRRCFSMGYFEYVMDEKSFLRVPKKTCLPLTPGHRPAMSECDCESRRGFTGFEPTATATATSGKAIGKTSKESFSISKICLRPRKDRQILGVDPSRRAFSFRFHSFDSQAKTPSFKFYQENTRLARWETKQGCSFILYPTHVEL